MPVYMPFDKQEYIPINTDKREKTRLFLQGVV